MLFHFVEEGKIDGVERRRLRSHVMKGKNANRPRPPRRQLLTNGMGSRASFPRPGTDAHRGDAAMTLESRFDTQLCFLSFPEQLTTKAKDSLHRWLLSMAEKLYPREFCTRFDIFDSIWVSGIFVDQAYYRCILGIAACFKGPFLQEASLSHEALQHLNRAYSLISKRLTGPFAVSDTAIAAVTLVVIFQQLLGDHATGSVHLDGLFRMIALRGGLLELSKANRALALKPLRLDLEFAMQTDAPLHFAADEIPGQYHLGRLREDYSSKIECEGSYWRRDIPDLTVPEQNREFFCFVHAVTAGKMDPLDYSELSLRLIHQLLSMVPDQGLEPSDGDFGSFRLAAISFMTTFLLDYGRGSYTSTTISRQLREAARTSLRSERPLPSFTLWVLFVGGISVWTKNEHTWLLPQLDKSCQSLGLTSWADTRRVLQGYAWIPVLHDSPGKSLWDAAQGRE